MLSLGEVAVTNTSGKKEKSSEISSEEAVNIKAIVLTYEISQDVIHLLLHPPKLRYDRPMALRPLRYPPTNMPRPHHLPKTTTYPLHNTVWLLFP